jgi:phospholipase/carboxylesterase
MQKLTTLLCAILFLTATTTAQPVLHEDLALKYLVQLPAQASAHPPVIILLHGYGSDEKDLFELRNFFPKNYIIISARAPYKLQEGGYQWYTPAQQNGIHDGSPTDLAASRKLIEEFIPQITAQYHAYPKEIYLMGFSQGAMMSYEVGLTAPATLRGIGVLSGTIYPSLKPLVKKSPALKQLRIFISHGTVDERVPFKDGEASAAYLKTLGLSPDFHKYAGMGHNISKDVLFDLVNWLKK